MERIGVESRNFVVNLGLELRKLAVRRLLKLRRLGESRTRRVTRRRRSCQLLLRRRDGVVTGHPAVRLLEPVHSSAGGATAAGWGNTGSAWYAREDRQKKWLILWECGFLDLVGSLLDLCSELFSVRS